MTLKYIPGSGQTSVNSVRYGRYSTGSPKLADPDWQTQTGRPRLEALHWQTQTGRPGLEALNWQVNYYQVLNCIVKLNANGISCSYGLFPRFFKTYSVRQIPELLRFMQIIDLLYENLHANTRATDSPLPSDSTNYTAGR